jgi:UDP-GlcNAc:undecaprenyl-phosphate/decaprenyl-phosphate GlcNAc-1-phosphate transferase
MRHFVASPCEVPSPIVVNRKQKVIVAASVAHVIIGDGVVRAGLACGAIVAVAEPPTIALLRRLTVLDLPGERSSHSVPTPRGGGAPIAAGLLVAAALTPGADDAKLAFAVAVGFFGLLGLLDDLRGLPAIFRLALQTAGAAGVATLLVLHLSLTAFAMAAAALIAAVWLVGFVNAFNFMDGVNGISAAHAVIGGAAYACLAAWRQDGFGIAAGLALAAGACAFLPWNAGRARVFLGDVGSYSIGAALAVLAVRLIADGVPAEAVAGPVALYLADVAWTLQRRIRRGEPWLEGHRTHVYQRWCDAGWSHQEVTLLTSALTVLLCLLGVVGMLGGTPARVSADLAGLLVVAVYLGSPGLFARAGLRGADGMAARLGRVEAIGEMEEV